MDFLIREGLHSVLHLQPFKYCHLLFLLSFFVVVIFVDIAAIVNIVVVIVTIVVVFVDIVVVAAAVISAANKLTYFILDVNAGLTLFSISIFMTLSSQFLPQTQAIQVRVLLSSNIFQVSNLGLFLFISFV